MMNWRYTLRSGGGANPDIGVNREHSFEGAGRTFGATLSAMFSRHPRQSPAAICSAHARIPCRGAVLAQVTWVDGAATRAERLRQPVAVLRSREFSAGDHELGLVDPIVGKSAEASGREVAAACAKIQSRRSC
jgi:hypothetical protein